MTKQQVYKKYARYLNRMTKKDRDFSKFLLAINFPTKNQKGNLVYSKLNPTPRNSEND